MSAEVGRGTVSISDPAGGDVPFPRGVEPIDPLPVPKYTREEMARLGPAVYEQVVRPQLPADVDGKYVVLDPDTGGYVVAASQSAALQQFQARHPGVVGWIKRVGYVATMRPGNRPGGWRRE